MSEIVKNPEEYFRQFVPQRSELLKVLEDQALKEEIPIVGPVVGELLFILARIVSAEKILELGTATGYSAIFLASAIENSKGSLVTLENDPTMAAQAMENIRRAGLDKLIKIKVGDALEKMAEIKDSFDMIFMDIEKEDYIKALPFCEKLLKVGGLLVADNVGFKDADFFNQSIFMSDNWRSVSLFTFLPLNSPEKDGLCIAVRL